MSTTYWIQNADLSTAITDEPVQSADQVLAAFDNFDWAGQNQILDGLGSESCPPGLGVVRRHGIILHICPNKDGTVMGFWHREVPTKILGIFKSQGAATTEVQNMPMAVAREAIFKFIKGDDEWLARNFKDR